MRGQLDVCQAYDIPVAYFAYQSARVKNGKIIHANYSAWNATDPIVRSFYKALELRAQECHFIPDYDVGYRQVTPALIRWSEGRRNVALHLSRTASGMIRAQWTDHLYNLFNRALSAGSHRWPQSPPYAAISYQLNAPTVAALLKHSDMGFAVASVAKRAIHAPIILKIQPRRPVSRLSITLNMYCTKDLGGSYEVRSSINGRDWSAPVIANRSERVTVHSPKRARPNKDPLYVEITMAASAGVHTATACALTSLEVTGIYP